MMNSCPRCYSKLRRFVAWRGGVIVAVGLRCPTIQCRFAITGGPWKIAEA